MEERVTVFDRSFNIRMLTCMFLYNYASVLCFSPVGRFVFSTPFTSGGKAHGDVDQQYMRKTILTANDIFPYVKRRSKVIKSDSVSCWL